MVDRYYAFPDIHGMSNLLDKALNFVYKENPDGGKIIFLGDYIDRGPDNKGVIETMMNPPDKWEFIQLMGNHEEMFLASFLHKQPFFDTSPLFEYTGEMLVEQAVELFPVEVIQWMQSLKYFHFEGPNVFAHAFYDPDLLPEHQSKSMLLWSRYDDWEPFNSHNLHLTHGHTPRKNGPIQSPNRTNLDAGSCFYSQYVIGEYHKDKKGPVAFHKFYPF